MRRWLCFLLLPVCSGLLAQQNEEDLYVNTIQRAHRFLDRFKADSALTEYNAALAIAKRANNGYRIGRSLLGAGQAQWYLGRNNHAVDTIIQSMPYLRSFPNDKDAMYWYYSSLRVLGNIYDANGDYEKAFLATSEALDHFSKGNDDNNQILTLVQMANLYRSVGDYPTSLRYYEEAEKLHSQPREYDYRELYHQKGRLYTERGLFDSAEICYNKSLPGHPNPRVIYVRIAENYLLQNKLDKAWEYLMLVFRKSAFLEDSQIYTPAMIGLGKIFLQRGQTDSALRISSNAFDLASAKNAKPYKRDAALLLSDIYLKRGDSGRALSYYRQYVSLKDSVVSAQFKGQLYAFATKAEEREHASQVKLLRWSLVGLVVLGGLALLILLLRTNNEKLKMRQRAGELEMQALRAQMNPHFIFNCLSAINHFILNNDAEKASIYLTGFARLIRLVLINSGKATISLEEEIDMLKLYLNMEQLRFVNSFDYHIGYDESVKPAMINVPSFILQPFCENAIWHGLLHKDGKGELRIDFHLDKKSLVCIITDNGIGRKKAEALQSVVKEKTGSFGHKLTTERISLFNKGERIDSFLIEDLSDRDGNATGTRITIRIQNKTTND